MKKSIFKILLLGFIFWNCKSSAVLFSKGKTTAEAFDKTVSFTKNKGLMIVPIEIDGETYRFLFDTGAPMVISTELQAKLQCKKLTSKGVGDSQGRKKQLDYVRLPEIELAGQRFEKLTAIVADLNEAPAIGCFHLDGIIGANMMRLAFWEIDYKADLMRFTNVWENIQLDSTANHFNFYLQATGTPVIPEIFLDSVRISNVTFDTGSAGILGVSNKNLPGLVLDSTVKSAVGHLSSGLYGSRIDTVFYVQKPFVLGSDTIPNFPFEVQTEKEKKLLGMRYFKNYRMVLNWDERSAYLHPKHQLKPSDLKSFGISFNLENKHVLVGSLHRGSPAHLAGITLGDTVIHVNQISSPIQNPEDYCQILDDMNGSEDIAFEIKGKGRFNLKKEAVYREESEN
jgi:hypothetical protein